jgi:ribonuclease R
MDCERAANKYKQVEYMQQFLGEEFEAVITGVATFGFWAETVAHKCEGLVSIKDLNYYDEFRLIQSDYALVGYRSGRQFRMGDTVMIKVVAANLEKRQIDFEWIPKQGDAEQVGSRRQSKRNIGGTQRGKAKQSVSGRAPIPKGKGRKRR